MPNQPAAKPPTPGLLPDRPVPDAIEDLQRRHGLSATGDLDTQTRRAFRRDESWDALAQAARDRRA